MIKKFIWITDSRCIIGSALDLNYDCILPQTPYSVVESHKHKAQTAATNHYLTMVTDAANNRFQSSGPLYILGSGELPVTLYIRGQLRDDHIFVNNNVPTLKDALRYLSEDI